MKKISKLEAKIWTQHFHDAGQFVIGKQTAWLEKNPLTNGRTLPIIIPTSRVQDIDTEDDWIEAEKKFTLNYE